MAFNLLPLPVLDGGHVFLAAVEAVRRRPPAESFTIAYQRVGLVLIGSFLVFVLFNDLSRSLQHRAAVQRNSQAPQGEVSAGPLASRRGARSRAGRASRSCSLPGRARAIDEALLGALKRVEDVQHRRQPRDHGRARSRRSSRPAPARSSGCAACRSTVPTSCAPTRPRSRTSTRAAASSTPASARRPTRATRPGA